MPKRHDNTDPTPCPKCGHVMTVHTEGGSCVVCESTLADSPCFFHRGEIRVGHVSKDKIGHYIGRRVRGRHASMLGNPFRIKAESERAAAIVSYEAWLREKIAAGDPLVLGELDSIEKAFRNELWLRLLCWCRTSEQTEPACHGDVVAKVLRERMAPASQGSL